MAFIRFENISKSYDGKNKVIDNLSLEINRGDFITILGPSGCGKTTLMKMVNKLIIPDAGEIYIDDKPVSNWNDIDLRRSIGYVIQQIGLFPHLTIQDNISFVISLKDMSKTDQKRRAEELIKLVGLDKTMLNRFPRELSGGQKQRIGVARALASDPEIILMDEPFGAVDEIARTHLQEQFIEIQKKLNKTILFVTHDIEEALKLGSKIILLNNVQISQIGSKEDLIFRPENEFVQSFLGVKGFKSIIQKKTLEEIYKKESKQYLAKTLQGESNG